MRNSCYRCRNLTVVSCCFFMIFNVSLLTSADFFFLLCRIKKLEVTKDKTESESQKLEDLKAESSRIKYVILASCSLMACIYL